MLLSATVILLHSFSFIHLTKSDSCNVTAEYSMVAVELAQLHISDDSDILCLLNLESHIGALAINSVGRGLVVDSLLNSRILFLVPLTLWDDSNTNATEWQIDDAQCWLHLRPILGFSNDIHEMDIGNHLQLKAELYINDAEQHIVRAVSQLPEYFWYIHLHFEVPGLFHYTMEVTHTLTGRLITLELWQQESYPTLSNVRMSWMHAPSVNCTHSQLQITIRSGCPSQKGLKFIYPQNQTDSELARLPVNYRPPSPLGSSLPTSPHVYNADPSRPLSNTHFEISQNAVFKHCYGKPSRAECNCSDVEEHDVADSDCINKVYRHPYQQKFQLDFTISLGEGHEEVVTDPVSLMEVNGRTSFTITGLKNDYVLPDSKDSVRIKFEGPGLFHFQATVVTNSSFCNLTTYFTVFVDRAPLMKASEYSIIVSSTVVFGAVVAFMYLLYHFRLAPDNMHNFSSRWCGD